MKNSKQKLTPQPTFITIDSIGEHRSNGLCYANVMTLTLYENGLKPKQCYTCKKSSDDMVLSRSGRCYRCIREDRYWKTFGWTIDDFEAEIKKYNGKCQICQEPFATGIYDGLGHRADRPVLDHDHDTGEARSVICGRCNVILGMIDGKAGKWFVRAFDYLTKHKSIKGLRVVVDKREGDLL